MNRTYDGHPAIGSATAPVQLVDLHPFRDGTVRPPRLLSMLDLDRAGNDSTRLVAISEDDDRNGPLLATPSSQCVERRWT